MSPLTPEFFARTKEKCPEFFQIFEKTMPIMMKYGYIMDSNLADVLDGKEVYYLGMTGSSNYSIVRGLVDEVYKHVFSEDSPYVALYTLSSGPHERDLVEKFQSKGLRVCRFGASEENPDAFIALVSLPENQTAQEVVKLYENV